MFFGIYIKRCWCSCVVCIKNTIEAYPPNSIDFEYIVLDSKAPRNNGSSKGSDFRDYNEIAKGLEDTVVKKHIDSRTLYEGEPFKLSDIRDSLEKNIFDIYKKAIIVMKI